MGSVGLGAIAGCCWACFARALALRAIAAYATRVAPRTPTRQCRFQPSCSAYARQAIKKHGALVGVVLTTERLMHEGNEEQVASRIKKYGIWRVYDPVEANDRWWSGSDWIYQPAADRAGRQ